MPETKGLILGKFYPPHRGHQYLIDFARAYTDRLTVHVCPTPADSVPGALRVEWLREQFAGCAGIEVVLNEDPNPQTPAESPSEAEFYRIWRESLLRHDPHGAPDLVFASEPYGFPLAECLGARYVPVDHVRGQVPISGTHLRDDVLRHWRYLIPPARPYFARRIAVIGPESSGKSTLTARLAAEFQAPFASEYARMYLDTNPSQWVDSEGANHFAEDDLERILKGQRASIEAMSRQCETTGLVFSDTEAITTACWSEVLLRNVPNFVQPYLESQKFDLYLLQSAQTFWVNDYSQRVQPEFEDRLRFEQACLRYLKRLGASYIRLEGDFEQRYTQARDAVGGLMG